MFSEYPRVITDESPIAQRMSIQTSIRKVVGSTPAKEALGFFRVSPSHQGGKSSLHLTNHLLHFNIASCQCRCFNFLLNEMPKVME